MSIQDLGAIGELVAAIGVVISLVYLAVQIRQNTKQVEDNTRAVRATAVQGGLEFIFANRTSVFENAELSELFFRGMEDPDDLNDLEQKRFRLIMANALDAFFNTYSQTSASNFSPETWQSQAILIGRIVRSPGGLWYWEAFQQEYREDFRDEINRLLKGDV